VAAALAYDRSGAGPPVVLLHPLGADRRVWDGVAEPLTSDHEVVAVDLPGFGDSPPLPPEPAPTPARLAAAVAGLLTEIGLENAHVAGNSLGGWVALELALAHDASSVTAFAPAGLWPEPLDPKLPVARLLARAGLPLIGTVARSDRGRALLLAGAAANPEGVTPEAAAHLVRSYATAPGFTAVNAAMRGGVFDGLAEIEVPVTLVWPDHDGLVRRPRSLPDNENVHSVGLAGAGHIPMLDVPEAVAGLIAETIRGSRRNGARRVAR
jgi:pimeloyl-ACP methyl ester carboxylesterase